MFNGPFSTTPVSEQLMSERQTLSYLASKLQSVGISPKTQFGQNFLIDLNLLDLIARTGELTKSDVVLEVGTGMGSLTSRLATQAAHVVSVEIDRDMHGLAQSELRAFANVTLLRMDALQKKHRMHPDVLHEIQQAMDRTGATRFKLVANLPYNVATPIISNMLSSVPLVERMVVTIQRELGERVTAVPRTKDYSALSIWIQSQADCALVRVMPPDVFWPRPKIDSAILKIVPSLEKRQRIGNPDFFHKTVRDIFCHRRKLLRSSLISALPDAVPKTAVDELIAALGFPANVRAEELSIDEFIRLVDAIHELAPA